MVAVSSSTEVNYRGVVDGDRRQVGCRLRVGIGVLIGVELGWFVNPGEVVGKCPESLLVFT